MARHRESVQLKTDGSGCDAALVGWHSVGGTEPLRADAVAGVN